MSAADEVLRDVLSGVPFTADDQDAIYAVGRFLYEQSQHVRAAEVFRLLALLAPKRSRSWTALAACHEALGDVDRARTLYALALDVPEHDNHRPVAAVYKARLDIDAGDEDAARASLESCDLNECEVIATANDVWRRLHERRAS